MAENKNNMKRCVLFIQCCGCCFTVTRSHDGFATLIIKRSLILQVFFTFQQWFGATDGHETPLQNVHARLISSHCPLLTHYKRP